MSTESSDNITTITPGELKQMLSGSEELALLDVREELSFGAEHLLYASCFPLSRLELNAVAMIPRRNVPIVLCEQKEALAKRAAKRLLHLGYRKISVLQGGVDAWKAEGYEVFSGVNVPSKAFGEFIEAEYETPSVSADELNEMLEAGEDLVVLDSRPMTEYQARNIPTGICVPGGELVYRVHDIAPSPETLVVVNCAGRTRSIIGAQSLINAGIPNPVVALRNGTMGWHLAGHALETGMERRYKEISNFGLTAAKKAAERVCKRYRVNSIDQGTLKSWLRESDQRSLYLLDVRSPEEYEAGHLRGSRSAPGGQLVQETDKFVPTLHARIILIDDNGVRAGMTASWLKQMGWEHVVILAGGLDGFPLETGPEPVDVPGLDEVHAEMISPDRLFQCLSEGNVSIIDLSLSRNYKTGHLPGAWFAVRARLEQSFSKIPQKENLVLSSEDGTLALLAAAELEAIATVPVKVLEGGNLAWEKSGYALHQYPEHMADDADDIWLRPYEKDWGVEEAMQDYLTWEVGLVPQIQRDGSSNFWPKVTG
ncbi:MAG: thiosulfate sulfurtransferase [SAR324 cluster bacterium]|nr:thiosulfate sulfurtransferase [SAR324 cluster bacterium]